MPRKVSTLMFLLTLYLNVISASDPVCRNNISSNKATEGDYIEYSCMVEYQGRWAAAMEWKNTKVVLKANNESTGTLVKYTLVVVLTPEDNGQRYSCRTYFDQPKHGTATTHEAGNIPTTENVLSKYTSQQITVYCKYTLHRVLHLSFCSASF